MAIVDSNRRDVDNVLKENLNKFRFDHMNSEKRKVIESICREYKDIFYCENIPLSFNNQVKHRI